MDQQSAVAERTSEAERRIRAAGQRPTKARLQILQALLDLAQPVSHGEIQEHILEHWKEAMDRVTLYRGLDWLVQHQLTHRITADDRVWRFSAINLEHPSHPHFHCLRCGQVLCLPESQLPQPILPDDYRVEEIEMVVNGICPHCQKSVESGDKKRG
jgi:Fur family ferric uptake transcriptional regulator